jgi:hypothetical protein
LFVLAGGLAIAIALRDDGPDERLQTTVPIPSTATTGDDTVDSTFSPEPTTGRTTRAVRPNGASAQPSLSGLPSASVTPSSAAPSSTAPTSTAPTTKATTTTPTTVPTTEPTTTTPPTTTPPTEAVPPDPGQGAAGG